MKIKIGNKLTGKKEPCFIIAEAGVNHNGELGLAKKIIDAAKEAGANAIKFQTFKAENLVTKDAKKSKYQETGLKQSHYSLLKRLELTKKEYRELFFYCQKKKIIFLSTPYDEESADFLEKLGVIAFKVGSGELTHLPLLKHIAKKKLPMIIATGGSYLKEVREAVKVVRTEGNNKIILLHSTSLYPTPFEDVNLKDTMFHDYPGLDVFIKVKYKKKQWLVGKEVVLPIQNKIFLLFGNPENFQFLYDTIVHLEGFHHLV